MATNVGIPRATIGTASRLRKHDWIAIACGTFIVIVVAVALLAQWIAPHNPDELNILAAHEGPSASHLLGTDELGRDLLSRLIYGARLSLLGPAMIVAIATLVGTFLAIMTAWMGGWFDLVVSRVLDILFAFPGLVFALLAVAIFGPGLLAPVIALSIAYVPYIARVLRSVAMRERNLPYIQACYVEGLPTWTITLRHLLPNIFPFGTPRVPRRPSFFGTCYLLIFAGCRDRASAPAPVV